MTNYISQDRGRPLHVYDADKLKGAIRARLGKAGEKFLGLDGKEYSVDETMCVIADDNGPARASAASWAAKPRADGSDEKRADRERVVRSAQNGRHGAQNRPRDGRALSLRARRRSGDGAAGARSRDRHDPEILRRQAIESQGRRKRADRGARHAVRFRRASKS